MRWITLSGIVFVLLGLLIFVSWRGSICKRAVQAGVGMVVTADQAFEIVSGCKDRSADGCNMDEFHAIAIASEQFEEQFRELAKECLQ